MDKKETIKQITDSITHLIEWHSEQEIAKDKKWKIFYDSIVSEIEAELRLAKETEIDYTNEKLNFNLIELEGYKRALITMLNKFKEYESYE